MRDSKDFDRIYRENFHALTGFARRFISDGDACQDIVNDVFEDVWRDFPSLYQKNIKSYLYSSVRNRCIDHLRHSDCHKRYVDFMEKVSARYVDTEKYLEHKERIEQAKKVIENIGPPTNKIMLACYVEGKKYSEVAEEMGMSIANVKKHMVKALRLIREKRLKP